jgi:putative Mg2+ transporter-C (MgtC) family protein
MPIHLEWSDIAVRLLCTALAGALIGINRGEHGRPAGLRTTMLVALAACISMIQVNLLLPAGGKPATSFVVLDLMRLPLGILSGMGFIGAGAILRRDNFVVGITTAATLWFVTVLGLCFGGGQILLGLVGLAAGLIVLAGLKQVEERMKQDRQGTLSIVIDPSGPGEDEIRTGLVTAGFKIISCAAAFNSEARSRQLSCELQWRTAAHDSSVPEVVRVLARRPGVNSIAWTPQVK